jgi:hypothetical protein
MKTTTLPVSVAYSHSLHETLYDGGCKSPEDFSLIQMPIEYGDCLVLHTEKALGIWESLPKDHPDNCAIGYGAGTGMYIRE